MTNDGSADANDSSNAGPAHGPGGDEGTGYGGSDSVDASSEGWGGAVSDVIGATMAEAKIDTESKSYTGPPVATNKANIAPSGYFSLDAYSQSPKTTGWAPGKALLDRYGNPVTLEAHENKMDLADLETLRQQAYAAKNAKTGWDVPFLGNVSTEQIAQQAMAAMGGVTTGIGSAFLGMISQPYNAKFSGTAAERAALGYYGPGFPTGMPNVGPFMDSEDRNWDDARWSEDFNPAWGETVANYRDMGGPSRSGVPSSPAGGEVITVAAPPGAPDQRVTQFKALYPADWTETLTDEEIIEMVENPDQLRFWLSWRQT